MAKFALKTQIPRYLYDEQLAIEEIARGYGLDFFPTVYEVLSYDQMNEVASYGGFPTRYQHWRFGMEYERMSKSAGNYVGITEPPDDMFGKLMSVSDELMWEYYTLLTDVSPGDLEQMKRRVTGGELHPKQAKVDLACRIVADFHSAAAAREAAPPMWKVRMVSWVPGSPMDWAATTPTASPMFTGSPRARSRP